MKRLEGRIAIVTGAGQGIGEAIARRFSSEGARVVIAERNEELARKTASAIEADTGNKVVAIQTDVADPASVDAMHAEVRARLGAVDILVNNAGIAVFREPLQATDEDWRKCMSVDLEGVWYCCRAVLPGMLEKQNGAIINIISNHSFSIIKGTFPYPIAKHGLLGLTRSLALEYADRGIAVNAISPGYVDTPIADWDFSRAPDPTKARRDTEAKQPVGRLGKPSEIAAVAALLASDEARFMIGENIVIDGGVTIRMYE
jgi:NAD(P)-dependent dehydrogenase (short-subunit alcohol dehydrogenase family)